MSQERYDVCIVGGGIIGLSIANQLAKRNRKVVVVEKAGWPATEASADNAAITWPFAQMLYERYIYGIIRDGIEAHKRLSSSGMRYNFGPIPCIWVFFHDAQMNDLLRQLENMPSTERFEVMTKQEVLDAEPTLSPELIGGIKFPDCTRGEANMFCGELIRETTSAGVTIKTSAEVTGFVKDGRKVKTAITRAGEITADEYVISAGPWSSGLSDALGIGVPTMPIKGHIISWRSDPPFLSNLIWTNDGVCFPGMKVVSAGGGMDFTGYDKTPCQRTIDILASNALKIVPGLEYLNAPSVWTGLRPGSPDSMPLIGYSKRLDNVVIATGHYHEGFSMSAITGELVAEMMTKAMPDKSYLKMYDPDRFNC